MANELQRNLGVSGLYPYALIDNAAGQRWSTVAAAFVTYAAGDIANYDVPLTERGTTGVYLANFPAGITAGGRYRVTYGVGLSEELPSIYDAHVGEEFIDWDGSAMIAAYLTDGAFGWGVADAAGLPTTVLGRMRRFLNRWFHRRTKNRTTKVETHYAADGTTPLHRLTTTTTTASGETTDSVVAAAP